jgi:hypothetical protein
MPLQDGPRKHTAYFPGKPADGNRKTGKLKPGATYPRFRTHELGQSRHETVRF